MQSNHAPRATIVGPGRAGSHLAAGLSRAGWDVDVVGRGRPVPGADVTMLAVRDGEIEQVARVLGDGRLLCHLSGARGPFGAVRLAIHPAMTFPCVAAPDADVSFDGVGFALTAADDDARSWGRRIVTDLGGQCVEIAAEERKLYHAACALASNVLVLLEEEASEALRRAGVKEPREFLAPLVAATVANWTALGDGALSGPIVRGDHATIAAHLAVLEGRARALYEAALP